LTELFHNILIGKLKHFGDVLTTSPLISGIKSIWPQARISYLVNPGAEDLVRFHPEVDQVFTVPRKGGVWRQLAFIRELRRQRFDLVLELSEGDRGAFLAWASGAPVRVGYQPLRRGPLDRRLFLTHRVTTDVVSKHTVEYHLDALRRLGVDPGFQPLSLFWPSSAADHVRELLACRGVEPGRDYAVVHPTSRWMFKAWHPAGNAEVIDYLAGDMGLAVIVTAAPETEELDFVRDVLNRVRIRPYDLSGRLTLPELAALIAGARLFFGVDSLPMHMAAAVSTPAVVLFGPSGEHMWGPWGEGHTVVSRDWDCRPCGRAGCDDSRVSRCLLDIQAREIYPIIEAVRDRRS